MKFLEKLRKRKEEKKVFADANNIIQEMIYDKALKENKEKQEKIKKLEEENKDLRNNLEVLINTIEQVMEVCKSSNAKVVSKTKIMKIIGGGNE